MRVPLRIGINGFGRMGRLALRAGWMRSEFEFVQINETGADAAGSAHLLKFDSVHGIWPLDCDAEAGYLRVDHRPISYGREPAVCDIDWSACDLVIEATGTHHQDPSQLQAYFEQGVTKVLVAAPVEGALNLVYGVNHARYDPTVHHLITAASCTTNCLAPLVKVMHESIGIVHGCITTLHDVTNSQVVIDKGRGDLRRARASNQSLIPTSTGSARAIADIFPELEGRLNGLAVRVPILNASLTDFVFEAAKSVTIEEVNGLFKDAANGPLAGILGYEERPLVSVDFVDDPRSTVVDALSTMVVDERLVKIYAWYDNEWGYVNRLLDIAAMIANTWPEP